MPSLDSNAASGQAAQFPATLWSVVLAASQGTDSSTSAKAQEALAALCRIYWYPLYAYVRRQGHAPHDAQDLTQGFFAHLLANHRLAQVSPEKGKFRSFLLASLRNFLADERDRALRQKRGGGQTILSIDAPEAETRYRDEPADLRDPEKIFERRWAMTLLERALDRLQRESAGQGKAQRFDQLHVFLTGEPDSPSYAEVGRRLDLTEGAVKVAVLRLRHHYQDLIRAEIAQTVADESEIDEEMRYLFAALRGP